MLSLDVRSLDSQAAQIDSVLPADDDVWQEGDTPPLGGVRVVGRLSTAGSERYYFSGRIEGTAQDTCRRCLVEVSVPVTEDVHLLFAESDGEDSDDSDVYIIDAHDYSLDLRPAVREQWLLAVPSLVVCREDCQGLCTGCGAELNLGACACAPTQDPRWNALRSLDESAR